jgi:hypothetical protein
MADLPISNRYKAYKEGTESLVRWITRTASRHSNAADFLHTLAAPGSSAITLSTRDLVTLTKLVVANIAVDIPENILKITQDVVAEREVCANWYKDLNMDGESTASDKTHAYFIGTLHEIYHILDSARASRKQECPRQHQQTPVETVPDTFNNLFQHLKVEEPVENPLGTTTGIFEGFTAADKLTFRLEKDKDDKAFAIWCLLGDFSAVREHIAHVWQDYEAGKTSLLVAGAITDTAFGLMRHANEDFAKGNGDVATYQAMLAFLEEEMLVPLKDETVNHVTAKHESTNEEATKDEKERKTTGRRGLFTSQDQDILLCREAGQFFESLTKAFRGEATDAVSPGNESPLGGFGDTLLKLVPSIQQMAREDPATCPTKSGYSHRLSADEFVSALMKLAIDDKYPQAPIWLVAAGQIYMEIHTILHGKMSCGVEGFHSFVERIRPLAKRGKTIAVDNPYRAQMAFYERLDHGGFAEHFDLTKELAQIANSQCWNFTFPKCTAIVAHFLPIYPCCLSYRIRFILQYHSMQYLSNGMVVLTMAHLYRAGQKYGLIKSAWKDMDFILANHVAHKYGRTGNQPIVSKLNERADAFGTATLFRAALGVPTVDLNKPTRPRLPDYPNTEWRCITHQSDLIQAMVKVHRGVDHLNSSDREFVNIVLRRLSDAESKGKKKGRKGSSYTLVELLETYGKHLRANEPTLTFDYISFVDVCAYEIRKLGILYHPRSVKPFELLPWDFVDCMLWTAADVVQKSKSRSSEELHQALLSTRFGRTVTDLDNTMKTLGSKSSNYL